MRGLKDKSKRVAEMIMFCLDNKRKMETIVNCYCQLILKKQDLQRDL
jgi:ferredoxin-thioredoxin reductase catalytic subunit